MLEIKYYKNFKGDEDFLLVIGNADAYKSAISYLERADSCFLPSCDFVNIQYLGNINSDKLFLTKEECALLAGICEKLVNNGKAAHDYLSIQSLPEIDFLISYNEYERLP